MAKRYDFNKHILEEHSVAKSPFIQFERWYKEAGKREGEDASAMALATVSSNHVPSIRTVFLRGFDKKGFRFYTNYHSRKGKELQKNHNACLLFFWRETQRQIKIEGKVKKLSSKESDKYFASRPRGSQIGAWASQQSTVIKNRGVLDDWVREFTQMFAGLRPFGKGKKIPRPAHWGGYRLVPTTFEFWQGRASRLHDRIVFTNQNGKWKMERLSP